MSQIPTLQTDRLRLRPFQKSDVPTVTRYCGDWEVAATTGNIPHPYDESMAEAWISGHQQAFDDRSQVPFAITKLENGALVGAIGLVLDLSNQMAELGYWVGKPFWKRGYATEAARAVIGYGFTEQRLNRIFGRHMTKNPASGKVLVNAGMTFEGILRQSIYRWETFEDSAMYSILVHEYLQVDP